MRTDPLECQPPAVGLIGNFAQALKLFKLKFVEIRLQGDDRDAVGQLIVAEMELQSEIIANKNKTAECLIVPYQPGRKNQNEHK